MVIVFATKNDSSNYFGPYVRVEGLGFRVVKGLGLRV